MNAADQAVVDLLAGARVLDLHPDDMFIIEAPGVVTAQHARLVKERFAAHTNRRIIVIGKDVSVDVVRSVSAPLPTPDCRPDWHEHEGACFYCCETCNHDDGHRCGGCGTALLHDGREQHDGSPHGDCT